MADELVSLRQHISFLTTSHGSPNGMPQGRSSPNGVVPPQHGDSPLPSAATPGPLSTTQVPAQLCLLGLALFDLI